MADIAACRPDGIGMVEGNVVIDHGSRSAVGAPVLPRCKRKVRSAYPQRARRRAVTSISIFISGLARPQTIMVAAGRISPK